MKFYKIISKTVVATTLLGVTFGGVLSSISASANSSIPNTPNINNTDTPNKSVTSDNNATTTANSASNFQINSNTLTLDSVPYLNFGSASNNNPSQGGSSILPLNNDNINGDNSRLLEVTDYRKGSNVNTWNLNASMSNVQGSNNNNNKQGINDEWRLDLYNKSQNLDNSDSPYTANDTALTYDTNNNNNDDNYQQVMESDGKSSSSGKNTEGYGVNQIKYDNKDSAKLTIPNVAPGSYSANINWQLSTGVSEQDNG